MEIFCGIFSSPVIGFLSKTFYSFYFTNNILPKTGTFFFGVFGGEGIAELSKMLDL